MNKIVSVLLILVVIIGLGYGVFTYIRGMPSPAGAPMINTATSYKTEVYVTGLEVPWSMVFTGNDRMLVSERPGRIRIIQNGVLQDKPLFVFSEVWASEEAGLMGLTIDPKYQTNKLIYACLAYTKNNDHLIKVEQMTDLGTTAKVNKILVDGIIAFQDHDGCRLKFGPDGKLYITTGEATQKDLAQKLDSLNGKILRINGDGSIPSDNPFPNSPVFSYGHRNPQGIAWSPVSGLMWETEHGPSGFDGPGGGDEINLVKAGHNYGWPMAHHEIKVAGTDYPKLLFTPAIAPSGATFYNGDLLPQFKNNFFFTGLRGEGIWRMIISASDPEKVESYEQLSSIKVGRVRDIIQGPDGALYFSTSNRDGRGVPKPGDDKIYKIVP